MILAFDTSSEVTTIAVQDWQASSPARCVTLHQQKAAQDLLPAAQALLQQAGANWQALRRIAIGLGPGSFMGVRSACALAQGLVLGLGCEVVADSSLLLWAEQARLAQPGAETSAPFLVLRDARMGEVYWARYQWDDQAGQWRVLDAPQLCLPAQVAIHAQDIVVGNALQLYPALSERAAAHIGLHAAYPDARYWLGLSRQMAALTVTQLQPLYVRDKVAFTAAEQAADKARAVAAVNAAGAR